MEDKVLKNMVASEFVYNYVKDKRTVGIIREFPERNLIEMAEPIGVIFSVTPITNPTSTVLFKKREWFQLCERPGRSWMARKGRLPWICRPYIGSTRVP